MRKVIDYYKRVNGSGHIVEHIGTHESGDLLIGQLFESSENGYRQHPYDFHQQFVKIDKSEVDALERTTCGSRNSQLGPFERGENLDHWRKEENGNRTCSFCGSLHPDDALEIIKEQGFGVISQAKSYKWYVGRGHNKYYMWHNTPKFVEAFNSMISPVKSQTHEG